MDDLFRTVPEQAIPVEAQIVGEVPKWIKGCLLRNGPAMYEIGKDAYNHWFDGLGMLHSYCIEDGKVTYTSRHLRSQAFLRGQEKRGIAMAEFGTPVPPDPCKNIFARFFSLFVPPERTDNCSVSVMNMKGKVYAGSDSPYFFGFDSHTLQTYQSYNLRKDCGVPLRMFSITPHPHQDEEGRVYNVAVSLRNGTKYNFLEIPSDPSPIPEKEENPLKGTKIVATFEPKNKLCYYHSFAITPNYFVFIENPFVVNVWRLLTMKIKGRSFHECMKWDGSQPSRFYLISRKTGQCIARYTVESFFAFHHVNAYENDTDVFVDICCYPNANIVYQYYLSNLRTKSEHEVSKGFPEGTLRRYRVPVPPSKCKKPSFEPLPTYSDGQDFKLLHYGIELPQINYRFFNGKPYRFVYGLKQRKPGDFLNQIVKIDVLAKTTKYWDKKYCYPSEPVFIPALGGSDEDDGVIVSAVVGTNGKKSFLLILDAKTFDEVARAIIDRPVAHSLHGMFQPNSPITPGVVKRAWVET
ncbi:beta,beta-carotene 15,15'-dioxygenase-like [Actinia tenebrosa]|uniref:Beta,beta-carotene 15,15'-dioxygenase-like n=1 Tax=Actinia tenebrosa TaxID=6105 RepID=A0A1D7XF19_ACTTE|nr:beta,beta-carotene 15,15'-dioxygenase-like [Actinia tenebrosa]AOQ25783.1 beta,beta-carotene 15,15'-monooxygenase [Actinia tenebrosa]